MSSRPQSCDPGSLGDFKERVLEQMVAIVNRDRSHSRSHGLLLQLNDAITENRGFLLWGHKRRSDPRIVAQLILEERC